MVAMHNNSGFLPIPLTCNPTQDLERLALTLVGRVCVRAKRPSTRTPPTARAVMSYFRDMMAPVLAS